MYIKAIELILPVLYRKLDRGEVMELERAVVANRTRNARTRNDASLFTCAKHKEVWLVQGFVHYLEYHQVKDENVRS